MPKPYHFRIGQTEDGKPVDLDLATFVGTRAAIIANSGGGKSFALRTLIEQTGERVQWIVIDPEGEYSSLRERFPNMLLVGKEGELPVDVRSAKLLARKIMESRTSTIVDLYGLLDIRALWTAAFVNALLTLPKDLWSPVIVAVDEAQRLAPETPTGDKREREALYQSRKAIITLADSGRKQSRGSIIASQRVSKLASDARAELRNRFIGLHVQDIDRDRAADDLGFSKTQARALRDLKAGQFYVYGPAFIGLSGITLMQFDLPQTHHPQPGEGHLLGVPPASDALKRVLDQMGDLPQQVQEETNTLAAAQRRILELERDLHARPVQAPPKVEPQIQYVERPVLNGELPRLEKAIRDLAEIGGQFVTVGDRVVAVGNQVVSAAQEISGAIGKFQSRPMLPLRTALLTTRPAPAKAPTPASVSEGTLRGGEHKIMTAVAQYPDGVTREQLTVLTGYKRSSRDTYIQRLAGRGLVTVDRERVAATEAGVQALGSDFQPLPTGAALIEYWRNRLTGGEKAVFEVLVREYPNEVSRDALGDEIGYKRSSRDTYIQRLQARQLVTTQRNAVRASDELFRS